MAEYQNKLMQHLGIVAGVCDETKLAQLIDRCIAQKRRKVSVGQAVQAMIINALGFSGRALYLNTRFYENRPVDVLVGEGLSAHDLHDSSLGTALDAIYEYGITELFFYVVSQILKQQGIESRFSHLDSTTFSLHGLYNSESEDIPEGVIHITKGHSKDNAPELNQVVVQLICANKSSIPIWLEALSGNASDKRSFPKTVREFQRQFERGSMPYMVMDAAFYSKENLSECREFRWVTRVPETLKEVGEHYERIDKAMMRPLEGGYWYLPVSSRYGGIEQRWVIVYSTHAYEREIKTFCKNLEKRRDRNEKDFKHLRNQAFGCEADAVRAAESFSRRLRYQNLSYEITSRDYYPGKGRPKKNVQPKCRKWFITGTLHEDEEAIRAAEKKKGMFVVATNELDDDMLSDEEIIEVYKDQGHSVERGFRFLKDPLFYAESLYLKLPERIMALIMVMTLSLLIYSLAEMRVRQALQQSDRHIWDQKNRETNRPTIRWVFMIFEDVLLLYSKTEGQTMKHAMNIREEHRVVLKSLGSCYEKMYFL